MEGQAQPHARFDWELCADLHNHILDIGWAVVSEETGWEQDPNSWWEHYFGSEDDDSDKEADDAEKEEKDPRLAAELERRLHPDVIRFLKTARHDYPGTEGNSHFFLYLKSLASPRFMIDVLSSDEGSGFSMIPPCVDRYVLLYHTPDGEPGGLL
jgi:hypothetical protein